MELLSLILILVVAQHNSHLKFAVFIMKCNDALLMDMVRECMFSCQNQTKQQLQ